MPSLTALTMEFPTTSIWSFSTSSSFVRACSSAVDFSLRSQSPAIGFEPSRVPPRSFSSAQCHDSFRLGRRGAPLSNSRRPKILSGPLVPGSSTMLLSAYVCCSNSTLMTDLVGITQGGQQESWAPSAHECLKPLEACSLLIGKG